MVRRVRICAHPPCDAMRARVRKLKGIHLLSDATSRREVQVGASAETWSAGRAGCRGESGGVGVEMRSLELVADGGEAQSRDVAERPCGFVRVCDRGERSPCVVWAGCGGGAVQGAGGSRESIVQMRQAVLALPACLEGALSGNVAPVSAGVKGTNGRELIK